MIGTRVGKWKITQEIGDGGHAFVFKGEDAAGEVVAIKMLKPSVADEDNLEKRFIIEAEALKKLRHPNIVGFKDYIYKNGYHYLVLEYMDQGSVEDLIKAMGSVPPRYAVPIFYNVLAGIRFSHERGFIHRDLKPSNILINSEGEAKLTDFGIAKVVGGQNLTKQGFVLGTTLYMAPEFISKGTVAIKTDIYALGVTLYEMLTNRKPFEYLREDEPLVSFARRVCRGKATPPSAHKPIPPALERIVMTAIAQDPKNRYKSAKEFRRDLSRSFPDLVKRDIIVPGGRARTRYVDVAAIQAEMGADGGATAGGGHAGRPRTGLIVSLAILAILGTATFFSPRLLGDVFPRASRDVMLGVGGLLTIVAAAAAYLLLGRRRTGSMSLEPAVAPPVSGLSPDGEPSSEPSSDSLFGFDSGISDAPSSRPAPVSADDLDDTIPFHEGFGGSEPFKMTEDSELEAYLVSVDGPDQGRRFGLRPISRIGRDLRLDIRPHDPEISRHHAVLTFDGEGFTVEDLGSTNGTFVNDRKVLGKARLKTGDIVRCGRTVMRFEYKRG